jgi:hypothetical protein
LEESLSYTVRFKDSLGHRARPCLKNRGKEERGEGEERVGKRREGGKE